MLIRATRTLGPIGLVVAALVVATTFISGDEADSQSLACNGRAATIVGTSGNDIINGTNGADVIVGGAGNDRIFGNGGADVICGQEGRDVLFGGAGADFLNGGAGRDRLVGNVGGDSLVGGSGPDRLKGGAGPDRLRGGHGKDRCVGGAHVTQCEIAPLPLPDPDPKPQPPPPLPELPVVDRVIHISVDGLRSDHVTPELMPNLTGLRRSGASTLNARTDPAFTQTLPNHTAQFTGLPARGDDGHGVLYNSDQGRTVHNEAGRYVPSVFDVVHDRGGSTAMYVGKSKFDMIDRTWDENHGATDNHGPDDGRDKIDVYLRDDPADAIGSFLSLLENDRSLEYVFFHIRYPDASGHEFGWSSDGYADGVRDADLLIGQIVDAVDGNPLWRHSTAIIVVADHGGPTGELVHNDETIEKNYVIPFVVSAPGVEPDSDLYALNRGRRRDPGRDQPGLDGVQPIRGHDVANLALDLLGYDAIPGSVFNAAQDLRLL